MRLIGKNCIIRPTLANNFIQTITIFLTINSKLKFSTPFNYTLNIFADLNVITHQIRLYLVR